MANQNLKISITAVDKTRQAFRAVGQGLNKVKSSILSVQGAVAALGAGLALREFSQQIDELAKQSGLLGLTVNQLQQLQFAASQTGVTTAELNKGLERFSRSISEASTGIGVGKRSFDALGITLANSDGSLKSTRDLLSEVADRFARIKDPADRVRVAVDLFGRSGAGLVNTLADGSAGLRELGDEFNSVTLQLSGPQAAAVEEANDLFDKLGRVFASIGQQITAVLLPALAKVAKFFTVAILDAVASTTAGLRGLLNEFVKFANQFEGIALTPFTFGENLEKEIDRITLNLEGADKGIRKLRDGTYFLEITAGQAADQISIFGREVEETEEQVEETTRSLRGLTHVWMDINTPIKEATKSIDKAGMTMDEAKLRGIDVLEDGLVDLVTGAKSVSEAFRDMAASVLRDLARIAIQQSITLPLAQAMGFNVSGVRQMGGPVTAGRPYLVGERGPEIVVPGRTGGVIPNNQIGGAGVTVNQTINLTTGVSQTVRAEVLNMLPQIADAAKGAVLDAKRRGGSYAAAIG